MAESRLLLITPGIVPSSFSAEIAEELTEAGLRDVWETAQTLPPRLGIRASLAQCKDRRHISNEHFVDLLVDGFSSGATSVVLVRANAPQIPAGYILEAFGRLTPHRPSVVAGPTHNGGFYLFGASGTFSRLLLKDIFSGASNVLTETRKRTATGELSISLLPSLQALETLSDGQRLLRDMRRGVAAAPRTQYTLRKLGLE